MAKTKAELFAEAFVRRRVQREVKERIRRYCAGLSVDDFRYAAECNLYIITALLNPSKQKSRRKKIASIQPVLEGLSVDDLLSLVDEVSPEHAKVLYEHKSWFAKQVEMAKQDLFGS